MVRSFDAACRFLFARNAGGIKWGLETTERLLASLGNPHQHFAAVHIGGTNGKGSTATFLASMLRAAGYRVGLYTSPHLVSFTERMLVDGKPASEEAVTAWVARLEAQAEETGASFFEITTAVALADFAARGVDIAVIEVGLGGRLDATNVITPLAAGVTRIALEHVDYLGSDLAGIAREKAGIAKPGVPLLTTEPDDGLTGAMAEEARRRGTALTRVSPLLARDYALGLAGAHQVANASLAVALARSLEGGGAFRIPEPALRAGLRDATIPGRYDRRAGQGGDWLFDVAHNPDGMRALVATLGSEPPRRPLVAVLAVLRDKAWAEMIEILAPAVDRLIVTRAPSAPAERAWDLGEVERWCGERGIGAAAEPELAAALAAARASGVTVLVTGSFHTVGDALALLPGFAPLG